MRLDGAVTLLTLVAHVTAWALAAFLAFTPGAADSSVYGLFIGILTAVSILLEGESLSYRPGPTLLDERGLSGLGLLLVPVLLTGIAVFAAHFTRGRVVRSRLMIWSPTLVLTGFSVLPGSGIGHWYLPVACILILAALGLSGGHEAGPQADK